MDCKHIPALFVMIFLMILIALGNISGCNNNGSKVGIQKVINIDPNSDVCTPINIEYLDCAKACEVNPLGCANDLLKHIEGEGFISRRVLNPGTIEQKPNIQSPMHGLFVPVWVNPQLSAAINAAVADPFAPIDMPDWSISAKYNNNPGVTFNTNPRNLDWTTVMYKIPGYCPERIFPGDPDSACIGGEWFYFLYRGGFLSFDYDEADDTSVPAWGKAVDFCIDCHGAVADADWLWITHDQVKRAQEEENKVTIDGHTPADTGAALCEDVDSLDPIRPDDVLFDPQSLPSNEITNRMFNCYSWKTFISLFWPAMEGERGVPDTEKSIADAGPLVWETYKQTYEVLQPDDADWTLEDKEWNDPQPLPEVCAQALENKGIDPGDVFTINILNETHQAYGSQFNDLVDQNNNIVHYNVRVNRDEFETMKENGYADTGAYNFNGPLGINKRTFQMPDNTNGFTHKGATEVKSAWKIMCTNPEECNQVDDPGRYLTREALIYTPPTQKTVDAFRQTGELPVDTITIPAMCELKQVGLVGFHIAAKTFWAPQWIWPTFEHIDNVPGNTAQGEPGPLNFSFNNPACGDISILDCLMERPGITPESEMNNPLLACCNNRMNITNSKPEPGNSTLMPTFPAELIPMQVTRIGPIGQNNPAQASVLELNELFRGLLADEDSPLKNYVMINTQWPLNGRRSGDADVPFAISNLLCLEGDNPDDCVEFYPIGLRLRNSVIETYDMAYCEPDDEDIGNEPADCTPEHVVDNPGEFGSGGCMNCHFSAGTDSSFIWADGIEEQIPLN
jgi:hypothetical protein